MAKIVGIMLPTPATHSPLLVSLGHKASVTYKSSSKGTIALDKMATPHLFNAFRKVMIASFIEILQNAKALADLDEIFDEETLWDIAIAAQNEQLKIENSSICLALLNELRKR